MKKIGKLFFILILIGFSVMSLKADKAHQEQVSELQTSGKEYTKYESGGLTVYVYKEDTTNENPIIYKFCGNTKKTECVNVKKNDTVVTLKMKSSNAKTNTVSINIEEFKNNVCPNCTYDSQIEESSETFSFYLNNVSGKNGEVTLTKEATNSETSVSSSDVGGTNEKTADEDNTDVSKSVGNCVDYLGNANDKATPAYYLKFVYTLIKIASILIVIALTMLDFSSLISKTKNSDDYIKCAKKWGIRIGALLCILLLPSFIDLIGNIAGKTDILCGIK